MSEPTLTLHEDYEDLIRALIDADAEFVIVGGWAVAAHGHGRATDDLDIFVNPSKANAARVYAALDAFGAPLRHHHVTSTTFADAGYGYRIGRRPLLIEVLTSITGLARQVRRATAALVATGLGPGERFAIWAPNMWEWVVCASRV